jgi:hypothetical protein
MDVVHGALDLIHFLHHGLTVSFGSLSHFENGR